MGAMAIIPARYGSTRFPGKPLASETGKYLIQHVCDRVQKCSSIERVIVATDDERIVQAVQSFGGEVHLTRCDHVSGTDRVGEVVEALGLDERCIVVNVQGDEPEIAPGDLGRLVKELAAARDDADIATLATPFPDDGPREGSGSPLDPNCVKVVLDRRGRALYFSRSAIPYPRNAGGAVDRPDLFLLHLGVYAFRVATLRRLTADGGLAPGRLEMAESLEQLRWLEHGFTIKVLVTAHRVVGIDTPDDYAAFVRRVRAGEEGAAVAG